MLAELFIRNFAIIDELRIDFAGGFNVLTGETGAGKSIILDAMTLVLGERADATMIRDGCTEAYVEASFEIDLQKSGQVGKLVEAQALGNATDSTLILARELRENGRNICRVNGRTVNLALLKEFGEQLVDIHGQSEHLSLLNPRTHLRLLDAYAGLEQERKAVRGSVSQLRAVRRELDALRQDERSRAQRMDLLKYQIAEIDAANLRDGEEEELKTERTRLSNVEQLVQHSNTALALLSGMDDEATAVNDMLGSAERSIMLLAKLDEEQAPLLSRLQGLAFQLDELAGELLDYRQRLAFDPDRLDEVEERLELISSLKRKYGDDIASVLASRERAAEELENISDSEARIGALTAQEEKLLVKIGVQSQELSQQRTVAAKRLSKAVERELVELHMERATFQVESVRVADEAGVPVDDERLAFDETGIDRVAFLVSANPGESLKPLAKVASGGETSRLMLALKSVLASVDETPTLIFDEIDQGIGGRVGDVVGRKLWRLTAPAGHQVIVVTHLPQLAGYADGHFHVSKKLSGERTVTAVTSLDQDGRVEELAAMLGTLGDHATGGAESILQQVAVAKASR
jgi:DNA repair protein RecN (Recombination protein N)